ncbi:hypothetical protein ONZ45_g11460 [Pleurotus djamor]|nr:hypothetical protein ONZ45_g11460 [Pleurotus djamor]
MVLFAGLTSKIDQMPAAAVDTKCITPGLHFELHDTTIDKQGERKKIHSLGTGDITQLRTPHIFLAFASSPLAFLSFSPFRDTLPAQAAGADNAPNSVDMPSLLDDDNNDHNLLAPPSLKVDGYLKQVDDDTSCFGSDGAGLHSLFTPPGKRARSRAPSPSPSRCVESEQLDDFLFRALTDDDAADEAEVAAYLLDLSDDESDSETPDTPARLQDSAQLGARTWTAPSNWDFPFPPPVRCLDIDILALPTDLHDEATKKPSVSLANAPSPARSDSSSHSFNSLFSSPPRAENDDTSSHSADSSMTLVDDGSANLPASSLDNQSNGSDVDGQYDHSLITGDGDTVVKTVVSADTPPPAEHLNDCRSGVAINHHHDDAFTNFLKSLFSPARNGVDDDQRGRNVSLDPSYL